MPLFAALKADFHAAFASRPVCAAAPARFDDCLTAVCFGTPL